MRTGLPKNAIRFIFSVLIGCGTFDVLQIMNLRLAISFSLLIWDVFFIEVINEIPFHTFTDIPQLLEDSRFLLLCLMKKSSGQVKNIPQISHNLLALSMSHFQVEVSSRN